MNDRALLFIFAGLLFFSSAAVAQDSCNATSTFQIYFFYSETCPHCAKEKPLLEELDRRCNMLDVNFYPVSKEQKRWQEFAAKYNTTSGAVPMTFIGEKVFIGFSESNGSLEYDPVGRGYIGYQNQIISAIHDNIDEKKCNINLVLEPEKKSGLSPAWIFTLLVLYPFTYLFFRKKPTPAQKRYWIAGFFAVAIISIFIFLAAVPDTLIKNFALRLPFPIFVFVIALADGFNPCAFTILIILLSLLTYSKSRRDMVIIGSVFILTSALMYFIFIMTMIIAGAWAWAKYGHIIILGLGIVIIIAGLINLKDFFFFKKGVSLSISDKQKSKIMKKAGRIARNLRESGKKKSLFWVALGSTFLLAFFVNLVELGCTAILPTVYMATLINNFSDHVSTVHVAWTAFYSIIYIIPLLAILLNFVYTFRSARLSEKQGRLLKLVAGLFMLFFGMIMVFNPNMLLFG